MSSTIITMGIVFAGSYGLASIPFGLVITRMMGLGDLRKIGSGNIGATNVLRTGNRFAAALTLIFDIGKGGFAVVITALLAEHPLMIAIAAAAGVIGHCYPIWLKFNGGKGVATGIGVVLALNPLAGLWMISAWLVAAGLFRISSLAAMIAYTSAPILVYALTAASSRGAYTAATLIIAALSIWRHRSNISRIIAGEEPRIGK
jgi:glycerol-3-phosphate acyltransferase PlsY